MISKEEFIKSCDQAIPKEEVDLYNKKQRNKWITFFVVLGIEAIIMFILRANIGAVMIIAAVMLISAILILSLKAFEITNDPKRNKATIVMMSEVN